MFNEFTATPGLTAWVSGAATGIGLFAVVGAQSAFILRQGIARNHILSIIATCALIDAAFIFASVAGLRRLTEALPWLTGVLLWGGVAFLLWYALVRDAWLQRRNYQIQSDRRQKTDDLPDYLLDDETNPTVPVDVMPIVPLSPIP